MEEQKLLANAEVPVVEPVAQPNGFLGRDGPVSRTEYDQPEFVYKADPESGRVEQIPFAEARERGLVSRENVFVLRSKEPVNAVCGKCGTRAMTVVKKKCNKPLCWLTFWFTLILYPCHPLCVLDPMWTREHLCSSCGDLIAVVVPDWPITGGRTLVLKQ